MGEMPYSGSSKLAENPFKFWTSVVLNGEDDVVGQLAMRLMTIPASEACCERCFSYVSMIRGVDRHRLKLQSVDYQLFRKIHLENEKKRTTHFTSLTTLPKS
jgi:hypothetical protein